MIYLFIPVIRDFYVETQVQVIYSNQIVAEIFFTLRGLGLYYLRHIIYQGFKLHERRIATLSHFGIDAITRVIAPKRLTGSFT